MLFLETLEKLINEHGSATIMREQLALAKAQYAALERAHNNTQLELNKANAEINQIRTRLHQAEKALAQGSKFCCDHCGSPSIKRVGSLPDPVFGDAGAKIGLFKCADCQQETRISIDP